MSSKEIGRQLGISPSTVDNHIHAAITKLNARNRWHAAQLIHPIPSKSPVEPQHKPPLVPPLGGRLNNQTVRQRLAQVLTIAALALIVLTSASVIVMGAVNVFDLN